MSVFQLIYENPSLAELVPKFPALRRFLALGFETDLRLHKNNAVGLANAHQKLRVNLGTGVVSPA